jgi:hypothetical protein
VSRAVELLERIERDETVRARLAAEGSLFDGYHPEMQAVHDDNAAALERIVAEIGWPDKGKVGKDAADAAWRILQHAIARPDLQRGMLGVLKAEADTGRIPKWQPAYLEDRIACHEGRPQTFGTQFDWDEDGQMSPLPIAEPDAVDARREEIGLPPLAEATAAHRQSLGAEKPPSDLRARRAGYHDWAVSVGWRPA